MIIGAHSIVYSPDADADRAFFRDVLKFPYVDAGRGWLIFALPPGEIAIHPGNEATHQLYLMCDDVEREVGMLSANGVQCGPITNQPWGSLSNITLPSGSLLGLYQPKHPLAIHAGNVLRHNRSIPDSGVIPVLGYPDMPAAAAWLTHAFGFAERLRIFGHRIQMVAGDGHIVIKQLEDVYDVESFGHSTVMVRVPDADAHCARARAAGAVIANEPETHPYGERQYSALDLAGRRWTFSQTLADVDPADWGGEVVG